MNLLAINSASSETSIALISDSEILAEKSWHSKNDEAEKLMPAINQMLLDQGFEYMDLQRILVVKGPGSFTGLRIGVSVANTIAHLTQAELFCIDTFEYWHQAQQDVRNPVLVFAGSGGVYLSESSDMEPEIIKLEDLNEELAKRNINSVCGDITEAQKEMLNVEFVEVNASFGQVVKKIDLSELKSVKIVQPLYIKEPAITQSKKQICST